MKKFLNILFILVVVSVIAISARYVYKNKVSDSVDTTEVGENVDTENLPEGVEIVERDGGRVLRDQKNDFELELEDEWVVFSPTNIVNVSLTNDFSSVETAQSFSIFKNDSNSENLEDETNYWLQIQNDGCEDCYILKEIKDIDGRKVAIVEDVVALGDYKDYLFLLNGYLYDLSTINIEFEEVKKIMQITNFEI